MDKIKGIGILQLALKVFGHILRIGRAKCKKNSLFTGNQRQNSSVKNTVGITPIETEFFFHNISNNKNILT